MFLEKNILSWDTSPCNVNFCESKFNEYLFAINKIYFIIIIYKNGKLWKNIASETSLKEAEDWCNEFCKELNHTMQTE